VVQRRALCEGGFAEIASVLAVDPFNKAETLNKNQNACFIHAEMKAAKGDDEVFFSYLPFDHSRDTTIQDCY
jgi:hypothetical protein